MKKKSKHMFVCESCDYEFYSNREVPAGQAVKCPRCGENSAFLDEYFSEDEDFSDYDDDDAGGFESDDSYGFDDSAEYRFGDE